MNEIISNHDHSICTEGEGEAAEEEGVSADEEEDSSPSVKFGDEISVPAGDEGEEGMLCYPYSSQI